MSEGMSRRAPDQKSEGSCFIRSPPRFDHEIQMANPSAIDQTVIELSRKKIGLVILGSCGFVALGIWLLSLDADTIHALPRGRNPTLVHAIGIVAIMFFGLCGIVAIPKLFDKKSGLILSPAGIVDNASGGSAGLIPWSEIIGADSFEMRRQSSSPSR
jgi:hypothetical protein